jgi:hypothetical protein
MDGRKDLLDAGAWHVRPRRLHNKRLVVSCLIGLIGLVVRSSFLGACRVPQGISGVCRSSAALCNCRFEYFKSTSKNTHHETQRLNESYSCYIGASSHPVCVFNSMYTCLLYSQECQGPGDGGARGYMLHVFNTNENLSQWRTQLVFQYFRYMFPSTNNCLCRLI